MQSPTDPSAAPSHIALCVRSDNSFAIVPEGRIPQWVREALQPVDAICAESTPNHEQRAGKPPGNG